MDRPNMPTNPQSAVHSRSRAEAEYRNLRGVAFQDATAFLLAAGVRAELRPIDAAALAAAELWTGRRVGWPWHLMIPDWRRNYPKRFEVAIWRDGVLCALALGRPARKAPHLSLYYLERNPDPANPLRGQVTGAVLATLRAYAVVLGKAELRLMDPLPALIPRYCSAAFGFHLVTPAAEAPYCARSI